MNLKKLGAPLLLACALGVAAAGQTTPDRAVAVTIDDLPAVSTRTDLKSRRTITKKLLRHLKKARVPAVGFVNEGQLYAAGRPFESEVALLRAWLDAGFELGNHTYSHMSLHDNPLEAFQADILKGEVVTKRLLAERGAKIRYFRHPYLWTGLSLETKSALGEFLAARGYTIAPVSIDNSDWLFARAFDNARAKGDRALARRIGAAYVPYIEAKADYWERQSVALFGREIRQVLLLHANFLNAEYFDELARMLEKRGYRFITLDDALRDEAYRRPDRFVRRNGISWLHRWALDEGPGKVLPNEPKTPDFVIKAAGLESE